jgi:hypothetical protein
VSLEIAVTATGVRSSFSERRCAVTITSSLTAGADAGAAACAGRKLGKAANWVANSNCSLNEFFCCFMFFPPKRYDRDFIIVSSVSIRVFDRR